MTQALYAHMNNKRKKKESKLSLLLDQGEMPGTDVRGKVSFIYLLLHLV
jgi:hypothetical protein